MRTFSKSEESFYQFAPVLGGGYRMLYWGPDHVIQSAHLTVSDALKLMDHLEADPEWIELHLV